MTQHPLRTALIVAYGLAGATTPLALGGISGPSAHGDMSGILAHVAQVTVQPPITTHPVVGSSPIYSFTLRPGTTIFWYGQKAVPSYPAVTLSRPSRGTRTANKPIPTYTLTAGAPVSFTITVTMRAGIDAVNWGVDKQRKPTAPSVVPVLTTGGGPSIPSGQAGGIKTGRYRLHTSYTWARPTVGHYQMTVFAGNSTRSATRSANTEVTVNLTVVG
jgi:hypothetical protein